MVRWWGIIWIVGSDERFIGRFFFLVDIEVDYKGEIFLCFILEWILGGFVGFCDEV